MTESTPEFLRTTPSLFPFSPESVVEGLRNLENTSNAMLGMIVAARGEAGPADSFFHNLPVRDLTQWHIKEGDFEAEGELLYKAGLLYGVDLASHVAAERDIAGRPARLDADALKKAVDYLYDSYRGLNDDERKALNWKRQKARELLCTGSDILTLANAALSETVYDRLEEIGCENPNKSQLAQHVGVVDGAILVDAYRSYGMGVEPQKFETPVSEHSPNFSGVLHKSTIEMAGARPLSYEKLEDLLSVQDIEKEVRVSMPLAGHSTITEHILRRCVQIGPNSFIFSDRVEGVSVPRAKVRSLAGFVLFGLTCDFVQGVLTHQGPDYAPIATVALGVLGLVRQRDMRNRAQRQAEGYELPLTLRPVEF